MRTRTKAQIKVPSDWTAWSDATRREYIAANLEGLAALVRSGQVKIESLLDVNGNTRAAIVRG